MENRKTINKKFFEKQEAQGILKKPKPQTRPYSPNFMIAPNHGRGNESEDEAQHENIEAKRKMYERNDRIKRDYVEQFFMKDKNLINQSKNRYLP